MSIAETMERRAQEFVGPLPGRPRTDRTRHRGPRRNRPWRADLPLRRRALPAGGRAGAGQDAAGPHAGQDAQPGLLADPVHARPHAGRHPGHEHGHGNARRPAAVRVPAGPIFTQICLADEINRATPKTQSAMLETMQEGSVTAGGQHFKLKQPFFVMATQNPIEQEGTYPLPEAQLDRFFFKLIVGYCDRKQLAAIVDRTTRGETIEPAQVMDGEEIIKLAGPHPRGDPGRPRPRLYRAAGAGDASARPLRPALHEPVFALGRQSPRGADDGPGGEGAGASGRPLQRQLRGRAARPACPPCGTA